MLTRKHACCMCSLVGCRLLAVSCRHFYVGWTSHPSIFRTGGDLFTYRPTEQCVGRYIMALPIISTDVRYVSIDMYWRDTHSLCNVCDCLASLCVCLERSVQEQDHEVVDGSLWTFP